MKTMEQVWKSSLAAFALLASPQEETHAALAVNAKHEDNPIDGGRLLQDGRLLYEMGKLDEAESKLKQVVSRSPSNETAFYYLTLIQASRYVQNTNDRNPTQTPSAPPTGKPRPSEQANSPDAKQSNPPASSEYHRLMERYAPRGARRPSVKTSETKERGAIASKLEEIVLNEVTFDGVPLPDVLRFLDEESRKRDPEKKGINFLINPNRTQSTPASVIDPQTGQAITLPPAEPMDMYSVVVRFNLPLRNVRLKDVLDAIVRVADKPIEYSIEEYGVLFSQSANQWADPAAAPAAKSFEAAPLQVRTFKVDADKLLPGLKRALPGTSMLTPSCVNSRRRAT